MISLIAVLLLPVLSFHLIHAAELTRIPHRRQAASWTLTSGGTTGVAAMQLVVVSPTLVLIIDKVEANPLQINNHPAWGALYNLQTNTASPVNILTNTFCAGGAFLSNGTLLVVGGNPVVDGQWGDQNGLQALRLFGPCTNPTGAGCNFFENTATLHMNANRWYPTAVRIFDGSVLIAGGTPAGGFWTTPSLNTPSYEYFPKRGTGVINSAFLVRTVPVNLFPIAISLPDGTVFLAANNQSIIFNTVTNTETPLPTIPNGVRIASPFSATAQLLPLSPPNYTPEVLICGGSTISDSLLPSQMSSQTPASDQCERLLLTPTGIAAGWQVEHMLEPRVMPDSAILPTGQIVIINGAMTGTAGYGNVLNRIGQSNADHPAFTPSLYDPTAPSGSRFSNTGMPTSSIARMYHSTTSLLPNGAIMVAGSNPNLNVTTVKYATEYRVEFLNPPYMSVPRPTMTSPPSILGFGASATFAVSIPTGLNTANLKVALMDLGYATHATHMNSRLVYLVASLSPDNTQLTITAPPNGKIYPPGPGWIYLVVDNVASTGSQIMIGTGGPPPQ